MDLMAHHRIYAERTSNDKRDTSVHMKLMDEVERRKKNQPSLMTYAHPPLARYSFTIE